MRVGMFKLLLLRLYRLTVFPVSPREKSFLIAINQSDYTNKPPSFIDSRNCELLAEESTKNFQKTR